MVLVRETRSMIARHSVLVWLLAAGCNQTSSEKRAEVRSISVAIDRVRQAANPDKAPLLSELSRLPCTLQDVCQLRDRCVAAYQKQVEAVDQIAAKKDGHDTA